VTPLLKRILTENRSLVLILAVALVANVLGYFIIVRPLGLKSAGVADRAAAAATDVKAAEQESVLAHALVTGKARADEELSAFYQKVLPPDQTAARRMTYASLPALARRTDVRYEARTTAVDEGGVDTEARFGRMAIHMILDGDYENLREFVFELERSPEFVIIDEVTLDGSRSADALRLTINLSTFYRLRPNGA
jgi:type II secretion system (T2SS) protein M